MDLKTTSPTSNAAWPAVLTPYSPYTENTKEHKPSHLGHFFDIQRCYNNLYLLLLAPPLSTKVDKTTYENTSFHLPHSSETSLWVYPSSCLSPYVQACRKKNQNNPKQTRIRLDFSPNTHTNISCGLWILVLPHWNDSFWTWWKAFDPAQQNQTE